MNCWRTLLSLTLALSVSTTFGEEITNRGYSIDFGENVIDAGSWNPTTKQFEMGHPIKWSFVQTSPHYQVYVFAGGKRLWKSPPVDSDYWNMGPSNAAGDWDHNGITDFIEESFEAHLAYNHGYVISFNNGQQNYLIHCHDPLIEISSAPPPEMIAPIVEAMGDICMSPEDLTRAFQNHAYRVFEDPTTSLPLIRKTHAQATKTYQEAVKDGKQIAQGSPAYEAMTYLMGQIYYERDMRSIDPQNSDPAFTAILNDCGYFTAEYLGHMDLAAAVSILHYVLERDSSRTVAHLNYADALYELLKKPQNIPYPIPPTETPAEHYRTYYDVMVKAGKKDKIPPRVLERMAR